MRKAQPKSRGIYFHIHEKRWSAMHSGVLDQIHYFRYLVACRRRLDRERIIIGPSRILVWKTVAIYVAYSFLIMTVTFSSWHFDRIPNNDLFNGASRSQTRPTTFGRTPLEVWWVRRRDIYLTTLNSHKKQTSMSQAWFETTVPASKRPQTHALDLAATEVDLQETFN